MKKNIGFFYDFDLTLSEEFQQYPIFREYWNSLFNYYGIRQPDEYWKLADGSDLGIGYMEQMIEDSQKVFSGLTNKKMRTVFGPQIKLAKNIPQWFEEINNFSLENNVNLEHNVISLGILPLIEGTSIFPYINSINAGEFIDNNDSIVEIKNAISPFRKVEYIKRICKGKDLYDNLEIDQYHINYDRAFVFGDGQSDLDMFRYIHQRGGIAIGVFEKENKVAYEKAVSKLGNSVNYIVPRDYSKDSVLAKVVKESIFDIINRTCDMDFEIVQKVILKQLRNEQIIDIVLEHIPKCDSCKKRLEPKFYFS